MERRPHQVGGEEGLEVQQEPSGCNLLQPAFAGFLGLLGVWALQVGLCGPAVGLGEEEGRGGIRGKRKTSSIGDEMLCQVRSVPEGEECSRI